jgi:hypothetical protein
MPKLDRGALPGTLVAAQQLVTAKVVPISGQGRGKAGARPGQSSTAHGIWMRRQAT